MKLKKMLIVNRAPFERIELDFDDTDITVLSGINGSGKTTLISYIVDSWYELARKFFHNEFEEKINRLYRVSSDSFTLDTSKPSIVYLRYVENDGAIADYVDIRGRCSEDYYNEIVTIDKHIWFSLFGNELEKNLFVKKWGLSNTINAEKIFTKSIMTYFPAYRYETPAYLNSSYKESMKFKTESEYSGYLINPIEVISDLPSIANWIMDIILDGQIYANSTLSIQYYLNMLLTNLLGSKVGTAVRLGIGQRHTGMNRIAIMDAIRENHMIYPSIFNMSSGELTLLCLFGELIKQTDRIELDPSMISGVVVVDEIDKHLHIKLQKDILPKLISMFPNIQFIVSSHSPFFSLGLQDAKSSYKIIDLDNGGIECSPQDNELFREVYNSMIQQNEQFAGLYYGLKNKISESNKPIIITEGKSDWKHLKAAQRALSGFDLDIDYYEFNDTLGDTILLKLLKDYARIPQPRMIIGIFDRDNLIKLDNKELESERYVSLGNNVYMFAIPLVNETLYGNKISIEHYYKKCDLLKKSDEGRRLFLGNEFNSIGRSQCFLTHAKGINSKAGTNAIIDDKVYEADDIEEKNSIALSKDDFAKLILSDSDFSSGVDFSSFRLIFDVIECIIKSK